jgi:hypothetical protein
MIMLSDAYIYVGLAVLLRRMVTFCVILGLFILGRLALYVLKMRILRGEIFCGAAKGDYFHFLCFPF